MNPYLSVILPCRDEELFIAPCLRSLLTQRLSDNALEVLVVDGASSDSTRRQALEFAKRDPRVRVLDNPGRIVPKALNCAIAVARGSVIVRMDVHCVYPTDYLANCLKALQRSHADNVGGVVLTEPRGSGLQPRLVRALSTHPFGVGDAGFRVGAREGPADTVPFGCFPRETFERYGLFDERLVRNQDYEFNARIRAAGGTVWIDPTIRVSYFNQPSLGGLLRQGWKTGIWNAFSWFLAPYSLRLRHIVPSLFVLGIVVGAVAVRLLPALTPFYLAALLLYALLACGTALQQALRYHDLLLIPSLPPALLAYHLVYGSGTLLGGLRILLQRTPFRQNSRPWLGAPTERLRPGEVRAKA